MKFRIDKYTAIHKNLPSEGKYFIGQIQKNEIVVYQAYKKSIADFSIKNQYLGGSDFSFSRMTWIKPGFLWMMYRSGWAQKENQERILAIWVDREYIQEMLNKAVLTSFNSEIYRDYDKWKFELNNSEVRVQWDPDHDPFGNKIARSAIQIGIKGETMSKFSNGQIKQIEDITDFVNEQFVNVNSKLVEKLYVPIEEVLDLDFEKLV